MVRLRLLATSDLHMHLMAHDYHADVSSAQHGLCLTATLIAQARAEVEGAVLVDNGDFLQGSPLGDYVARVGHRPHPMIQAMAHLGYDAVNIGNHEFSHGLDTLTTALRDAPFPVISANTEAAVGSGIQGLLTAWTILDRTLTDGAGQAQKLRVGIIGVLPRETEIWDKQAIAGQVRMTPMAATVANKIPELRAAGADVVVVLAHCGTGGPQDGTVLSDGAMKIAQIDGVDAVVMGHVHMVFPGPGIAQSAGVDPKAGTLNGKPAVLPGFFGSHLGVIDLTLEKGATGWRVAAQHVETRAIATRDSTGVSRAVIAPDPALVALIEPVHQAARAWARRPIGHTPHAIHSFFALITDCPSVQLVNQAQAAYVTNRLSGGPLAHLPVLSTTAPFRAGGLGGPENYTFIPPGDLLLRHAADLYIHPNTIMALRLTGADLRCWLEHSVQGYFQIIPGIADQPLIGPDLPSFLYDTIGGLTYHIDLSEPRGGQRIHDLRWQGAPLDPKQDFILATNSYRGSGSGGAAPVENASVVLADQVQNRDILIDYMASRTLGSDSLQPFAPPGWRFRKMQGTSVVFDTSPLAVPYLSDYRGLALTPLYRTKDGFLRIRLTL
ncbi:MAG: bifunctional 2',3'-cyclic-nucleotide 2'-phosphodiesterase/3'-nucleotidase [Paracoccaceae bacterium]